MRIYVAGPLSADTTCGYLRNLARMVKTAVILRRMGHYPYTPGLDFLFVIVAEVMGYAFDLEDVYELNYPWIAVSEAVYMIARSPGTDREVEYARQLGIPVYTRFEEVA